MQKRLSMSSTHSRQNPPTNELRSNGCPRDGKVRVWPGNFKGWLVYIHVHVYAPGQKSSRFYVKNDVITA